MASGQQQQQQAAAPAAHTRTRTHGLRRAYLVHDGLRLGVARVQHPHAHGELLQGEGLLDGAVRAEVDAGQEVLGEGRGLGVALQVAQRGAGDNEGHQRARARARKVALHHHADAGGGQLALHAVNEPAVHSRALCQVREDRSHALGPVERELDGGARVRDDRDAQAVRPREFLEDAPL